MTRELRVAGAACSLPYRTLCLTLAVWTVLLVPLAQSARAELISTGRAVEARADDARARVLAVLDRSDVRAELERRGIAPGEARARVAALSDAEVDRLAGSLDTLPAGGSTVGVIATAILIVFFTLLLTDILGFTDVFPFVRKPARR